MSSVVFVDPEVLLGLRGRDDPPGPVAEVGGQSQRQPARRYEPLLPLLPQEDRLNVDETGHKENGWYQRSRRRRFQQKSGQREDILAEAARTFSGRSTGDFEAAEVVN